jgi:hypothetical protein
MEIASSRTHRGSPTDKRKGQQALGAISINFLGSADPKHLSWAFSVALKKALDTNVNNMCPRMVIGLPQASPLRTTIVFYSNSTSEVHCSDTAMQYFIISKVN